MANTIKKGMYYEDLKKITETPTAGTVIFSAARLKGNFEEDEAYQKYNNFSYLTKQAVRLALDGMIPGLVWLKNAPMTEAAKAIIPGKAADNIAITDCPADYRPMIFIAPKNEDKWKESRSFCITNGESWQLISVYVKKEDGPFTLSFTWDNSHAAYLRREAKAQGRSTYIRWDGQAVPFTVTTRGEKTEKAGAVKSTKGKLKNALKTALEALNNGEYFHYDGYFLVNESTINAVKKVLVNALTKKSEEALSLEKEIAKLKEQIENRAEEVAKGLFDESCTAAYDEEEITAEILNTCRMNYLKKFGKRINAQIAELEAKKGTLIDTAEAEKVAGFIIDETGGTCPFIRSLNEIVEAYNKMKEDVENYYEDGRPRKENSEELEGANASKAA